MLRRPETVGTRVQRCENLGSGKDGLERVILRQPPQLFNPGDKMLNLGLVLLWRIADEPGRVMAAPRE